MLFTGSPVMLVSFNKLFLSVLWSYLLYLFCSFGACIVSLVFFVAILDVLCRFLDTCTIYLRLFRAGGLALISFLWTFWSLCYNQIVRTERSVPSINSSYLCFQCSATCFNLYKLQEVRSLRVIIFTIRLYTRVSVHTVYN